MFAEMFQTKILTLAPNAKIGPNVYNGMQKIQVEEKNFMSELEIRRAILSIKVKNCEGSDQIPQRIIVDGAELLIAPFHVLFNLIYMQRTIPEQWLMSKIVPVHKKETIIPPIMTKVKSLGKYLDLLITIY